MFQQRGCDMLALGSIDNRGGHCLGLSSLALLGHVIEMTGRTWELLECSVSVTIYLHV